jgi:hypothetical protein
MPPTDPVEPSEGDIAPYPGEILILGGSRWLSTTGDILTVPFGTPILVQDNTRRYWEGRAAKAGYTLDDLLTERLPRE